MILSAKYDSWSIKRSKLLPNSTIGNVDHNDHVETMTTLLMFYMKIKNTSVPYLLNFKIHIGRGTLWLSQISTITAQSTSDKQKLRKRTQSCWIAVQDNLALSTPQYLTTIKFQPILSKSNSNFENIDDGNSNIWFHSSLSKRKEMKWFFVDKSKEEGW